MLARAENPVVRASVNAATELLRVIGVGRHVSSLLWSPRGSRGLLLITACRAQISRRGAASEPANRSR